MNQYAHLKDMAPLLVQVELTEACNLKCRFCYNSQNPRFNKNALEMLERLADYGVMQVTLTGGEPLLHPDFFDILAKATELFPNVMILSNGTLMDEKTVAHIHEYNVLSVSISVHGDKDMHEFLTGVPGSYDRSIGALREFLRRDRIPVASNFVLNAANMGQLSSTIGRLGDIGLDFMTITRFIPVGIGKGARELSLSQNELIQSLRVIHEHLRLNIPPHIEVAEATPFCAVPSELRYLANTCSYGYDRFYLDVDGNLMVCGLSRIPLGGNILHSSLTEIKSSSDVFQCFLKDNHVPEQCSICNLFDECHGGCRAAAMINGEWRGTCDYLMSRNIDNHKEWRK